LGNVAGVLSPHLEATFRYLQRLRSQAGLKVMLQCFIHLKEKR
jgi:hypothetical protein